MRKYKDIDRLLAKGEDLFNRVWEMGVEVEGGWKKPPRCVAPTRWMHDASVVFSPEFIRANGAINSGEIAIEPIVPRGVADLMRRYYPDFVNATCGLHVHMSFLHEGHYQILMDSAYQNTIFEYLRRWAEEEKLPKDHPMWERLTGKNQYCLANFWPDQQVRVTRKVYDHVNDGNRYTAINFCYGLHKTVECRLLPMFDDVEQAIRAVHQVRLITSAFIASQTKREKPFQAVCVLNGDDGPYQEYIVDTFK